MSKDANLLAVVAQPCGSASRGRFALTYGYEKGSRLWLVSFAGTWSQGQCTDAKSTCVPTFAPPPANLPY